MSKAGFRNSVLVRFVWCGHTRMFEYPYPKEGDLLYCVDCREDRYVDKSQDQLTVTCKKKDCTFSRTGRPDMDSAIRTAKTHVRTRNSHEVWVYRDSTPVYYVDRNGEGEISQGVNLRSVSKVTQDQLQDFLDTVRPTEDSD